MAKIFDNPVWNFLGKLADMVFLTALWLTASIPVVTIGASTAALYDVSLRLAENQEGYIAKAFFRSFRKNWKQATALWLLAVCVGIFLLSDFYVYSHMSQGPGIVLLTASVILAVIYLMVIVYAFPLLTRMDADLKSILAASFVLALKNLGWTIFMLVAAAGFLAVGLFVLAPLLIISVGATAYLHSKILHMVLKDIPIRSSESV